MNIVSDFLEFCFVGIFLLQVIILWALLTIDKELKNVQKDMEGWVK
jgi:hypothetical protein|tara:strand:+ start:367 stop:504 length:138 start_codon:yes stop_codon:yes gene_type:complete